MLLRVPRFAFLSLVPGTVPQLAHLLEFVHAAEQGATPDQSMGECVVLEVAITALSQLYYHHRAPLLPNLLATRTPEDPLEVHACPSNALAPWQGSPWETSKHSRYLRRAGRTV